MPSTWRDQFRGSGDCKAWARGGECSREVAAAALGAMVLAAAGAVGPEAEAAV